MLNVRDLYHHQEEYAGQEVTVGGWCGASGIPRHSVSWC